ncbi:MAG: DEAD/DEAH box helicase [Proteobacteria bacterium]|nr:DEAD/DEAH box helicase [Pseudomonadota bacterium]
MIQTLSDALEQRGYATLTPVQEAVTNPDFETADLLVSAQTGSGKTVGFGLAIAPTLLGEETKFPRAKKPLALIIAPTRELALQVKRELAWLYAKTGAIVASCVGGMDMREERRALDKGAHIVVATPGRLRDHIMRNSLKMDSLRAVVLDEADEMLDLGFREDLEFILGEAPESRRTLMFSATVPRAIANLAKSYQKDAVRVVTKNEASQHSDIEYRAMNVGPRDAENAIINVLRYYEAPNALVFCNTRIMVNRLTTRLSNRGFSVVALSGELSQNERTHALQAMRDGRARICIATDVAARGIDLPNLDLVVHADIPQSSETLLHRSGRTGRAGRKGVSALIVPGKIRRKAERILQGAKVKAEWCEAPSAEAVVQRDEERLMSDPTWEQDITSAENVAATKLLELHSPEKIAAAYLRLYKSGQSAPEELSASGAGGAPKPRAAFGPTIWFALTGGREAGAEPRRLLPMLCKAGDITKDDIGAIRVQKNVSFIEIRKDSVAKFIKAIGPDLKVEDNASLTQLEKPPAVANTPRPSFSDRQRDHKDKGPKRKSSKQQATDHNSRTERDKGKKQRRPKSKGIPHSSENWADELKRLEGAVAEYKPKRKNDGPKPAGNNPKAGPGKSPSATKRGKNFTKKKKT